MYDSYSPGYGYSYGSAYPQPASFGAAPQGTPQQNGLFVLGQILGGLGGGVASSAMQDPQVQAAMTDLKDQCQVRAKQGVGEWVRENWPALAFVGVALLIGNYITLSVALLQAGVRRKRMSGVDRLLTRLPGVAS